MPDTASLMREPKDDERTRASGTLRRLVRFLASALDTRYAFVSAICGRKDAPDGGMALWLARDYGLQTDFAEIDRLPPAEAPASIDFASALRLAWPDEALLAGLGNRDTVSLALVGAAGRTLGYLGLLDLQVRARISPPDHLLPLARAAAAELERWAASPLPS